MPQTIISLLEHYTMPYHRYCSKMLLKNHVTAAALFFVILLLIGSGTFSQRVFAQEDTPTPRPLPTHIVQPGETLSEIAKQYDVSLTRIMLFNGLHNANEIDVGQVLQIPTIATTPDPPSPPPTPTVESGQTVSPTEIPMVATPTKQPEETAVESLVAEESPTPSEEGLDGSTSKTILLDPATAVSDPKIVAAIIAARNRTYTVEAGDTFPRIALRTGVDAEALRALNRIDPDKLNDLYIGQTLLLPATGSDLHVYRADKEYIVQPGDSLGSIAQQFDRTMATLLAANYITDPDSLSVGQRLTIPQVPSSEQADQAQLQVGPPRSGFYYYTVQPGDTLSEIAADFDSTKLALLEYNGLPDEQTVYSGIELRIPYGPPVLSTRRPPVPISGTSFVVSLSRQQCWLFHGNRIEHAWTCSTGYGEWITRTGTFAVQSKIEVAQSSAYELDMPYWLGIYNVGEYENGIHGLPVEWDTGEKIWEGLIGEPATFGCAMLNDDDAAELFATAYIGMPIHVTN